MFPLTASPTIMTASDSSAAPEMTASSQWERLRPAEAPAVVGHEDLAQREMETVLRYWGYRPEMWRIVGFTSATMSHSYDAPVDVHPIVEVLHVPVIVRRQSQGLTERDTVVRHAFMRHLTTQALPVPPLVPRPDGSTYAFVPLIPLSDPQGRRGGIYAIEDAIYEIQAYKPGSRFVTGWPWEDEQLLAAAQTLGALHRASQEYKGTARPRVRERSTRAAAQAYVQRIAEAGARGGTPRILAAGFRRLAREELRCVTEAAAQLEARPTLPWLYLHSDYQPHNLGFDGDQVAAIYDFEAVHWDQRVVGLAYALVAFTGLRWEDESAPGTQPLTTPLVECGLDLERAQAFLAAYGQVITPAEGEAEALGDALLLVFPIVFANGIADDLIYADGGSRRPHPLRECRAHLAWAESFPLWVAQHRASLQDAWQHAGASS